MPPSPAAKDKEMRSRMAHLMRNTYPVAEHFALVPAAYRSLIVEFVEPDKSRWMAIPANHSAYKSYRLLEEHKIPVLPGSEDKENGILFVQIPLHARPLHKHITDIKQNQAQFHPVLHTVGRLLRRASTIAAPATEYKAGQPVLGQFALVSQKESGLPQDIIFMTPPYEAAHLPERQLYQYLQKEAIELGLSADDARNLAQLVHDGWHEEA